MPHPALPTGPARRFSLAAAALLATLAAGCAIPLPDESRTPVSAEASAAIPAPPELGRAAPDGLRGEAIAQAQTYRGVIPCADCAGQRLTLTLQPDWTWRLRRVYFGTRDGKDATFVSTGRWERTADGQPGIRLIGDRNETAIYLFTQENVLRLATQNGEPIRSSLNYSLTRQFELDPIADVFPMRGKLTAADGAATLQLCGAGKRYPVSAAGQGASLVDHHARLRIAPGAPVLIWLDGSVRQEGNPPREVIVVDKLTSGTLDSPCET